MANKSVTVGILLAAGHSRRFGATNKLLTTFRDKPLILHAADTMKGAGLDHCIAVVSNEKVAEELSDFLLVKINSTDQSNSLINGLKKARKLNANRLVIMLADMPFITPSFRHSVSCFVTTLLANSPCVLTHTHTRARSLPPSATLRWFVAAARQLAAQRESFSHAGSQSANFCISSCERTGSVLAQPINEDGSDGDCVVNGASSRRCAWAVANISSEFIGQHCGIASRIEHHRADRGFLPCPL